VKIPVAASVLLLLGPLASSLAATAPDSTVSCTAKRLAPFVGPYGVRQAWPVATQLPGLQGLPLPDLGVLLSDAGQVMDGYTHRLHVNLDTRSAYVVQQGGIAGTQTVFGPLPVASCAPAAP